MSTKKCPGEYDCYAKLAEDEPYFLFRAKDPSAAFFVRAWRYLRAGRMEMACAMMSLAAGALASSGKPYLPLESNKSLEAAECADEIEAWQQRQREAKGRSAL